MMRKHYTPIFKAQVVRELLKEEKTLAQVAAEHGIHPSQLIKWRATVLHGMPSLFARQDSSVTLNFTSPHYRAMLRAAGVQISMDGKGRSLDNVFVERVWRSVKYEEVYPNDYASPRDARQGLIRYMTFYNEERPHQALAYRTPAEVYRVSPLSE